MSYIQCGTIWAGMLHLAKGKIQEGKRTFDCKSESTVDLVVEKSFVGKIEKGGRGAPRSHAAIISSCFRRPFLWLFRLVVIHKAVKRVYRGNSRHCGFPWYWVPEPFCFYVLDHISYPTSISPTMRALFFNVDPLHSCKPFFLLWPTNTQAFGHQHDTLHQLGPSSAVKAFLTFWCCSKLVCWPT